MALIGLDGRKYFDFGIGTYIRHLVQAFYELRTSHSFVLFVSPEDKLQIQAPDGMSKVESRYGKYSVGEFVNYGTLIRRQQIDLFHEPHYTLPAGLKGRSVVTIHDLIHLKFPQYFNALQRTYAAFMMRYAVENAGAVIAVSKRTKEDILERFRVPDDRVHVIYNGVSNRFRKNERSDSLEHFKKSYALSEPFILYVGGLKPHKNIPVLLNAFKILRASHKEVNLVFAGEQFFEDVGLSNQAHELGVSNAIKDLGKLEGDDLVSLYNLADVVVLPSLYEGFGFSALETMACGTPVIVSDRGSLPEIVGDGAIIFEAEKPESFAEALKRVLDDTHLQSQLIERGLKQASKFSWKETASKTLQLYESLL